MAQININRFEEDFSRDPRLSEVQKDLIKAKEIYANGFYESGQFYERMEKPKAAFIYYQNALKKYPETDVANLCRQRLDVIAQKKNRFQADAHLNRSLRFCNSVIPN